MFRTNNNFDKLLEKATSNLRLEPDWPSILQICDLIRQTDCPPKYAVAAIKKKLTSNNPHQAMFALLVLESIVKNCGTGVHDEIASVANCESYRSLVKAQTHENVRTKILELMQAWAHAFRNIPKYRSVQDAVNILKAEGYKFPVLKESDAMFSADSAPEWFDGDVCHRCRVQFTMMQRKHHCRACGQVFCQQCSAKSTTLPKFGIEKEVRVCDGCYDQMNKPTTVSVKAESTEPTYAVSSTQETPVKTPKTKTAEELREEEELQLAIALSQSEAEQKEKERQRAPTNTTHSVPDSSPFPEHTHGSPPDSASPAELSRYLDRNFWEKLAQPNVSQAEPPSAPTPSPGPAPMNNMLEINSKNINITAKLENGTSSNPEMDEFVSTLKSQVEIFVNRMKSNSSRGRSIANDSSVQTLFMNLTAMHSRLLRYIQQQEDNRVHSEGLQDKLTQVKDSRAALDVLREEHAERLRRAAEQAELQRQLQMAHKLDVMRKKKQEYLQYQRQLALQRVQEQEREMQMRQEQQKHQYMLGGNPGQFFMQGSPVHQFQGNQPTQLPYGQQGFPMMPGLPQSQMTPDNPAMRQPPSQGPQTNIVGMPPNQHVGHIPQMNMNMPGMPQVPSMGQLPPGGMRPGGPPSLPISHMNPQLQNQINKQPLSQQNSQIGVPQGPQAMQVPNMGVPPGPPQIGMHTNQNITQPQLPNVPGTQVNQQLGQMQRMSAHSHGSQMPQNQPNVQIGHPIGQGLPQQGHPMMTPKGVQMMYMDPQMVQQMGQPAGHIGHMPQMNGPGPISNNINQIAAPGSQNQTLGHHGQPHIPPQNMHAVPPQMSRPVENMNSANEQPNPDMKIQNPIGNESPTNKASANSQMSPTAGSNLDRIVQPNIPAVEENTTATAELICFD